MAENYIQLYNYIKKYNTNHQRENYYYYDTQRHTQIYYNGTLTNPEINYIIPVDD